MTKTIINLCAHDLNLTNADGGIRVDVLPGGEVARVATSRTQTGEVQGIPLFETRFGEVTGLPPAREGVLFAVSGLVAGHHSVRGREDVFSPGELLRDAEGKPVGSRGLTRTFAPASVNLTPATAASVAAAMIDGRWKIITEYGDDQDYRVLAMDAALQALASAAGLAPGVIEQLAKLVGATRTDIFLRVFTQPDEYRAAYGTIVEWSDGVMFCAVSGATLEW